MIMTDAFFTGIVAIIVCVINNYFQSKNILAQSKAQHEETTAMIDYKLSELTKRVDKHNNVIERTYQLEKQTELQEEKISVANHRISDLENQIAKKG